MTPDVWRGIRNGLLISAALWLLIFLSVGCAPMECRTQHVPMTWADGQQSELALQVCRRRW